MEFLLEGTYEGRKNSWKIFLVVSPNRTGEIRFKQSASSLRFYTRLWHPWNYSLAHTCLRKSNVSASRIVKCHARITRFHNGQLCDTINLENIEILKKYPSTIFKIAPNPLPGTKKMVKKWIERGEFPAWDETRKILWTPTGSQEFKNSRGTRFNIDQRDSVSQMLL